nr:protein phosphatase 2C domain-containing protein [Desulfuromonas acetoxidans]
MLLSVFLICGWRFIVNLHIDTLWHQGSGQFNEDRVLIEDNLFGVFDGASSLVKNLYDEKSGAWWAAQVAAAEFACNDDDLLNLARRSNRRLRAAMEQHGVDVADKLQRWSTSAAVFRMNGDDLEWVQTGDCLIMAIDRDGQHRLLTPYYNHDAETLLQWQQEPGETVDDALRRLRPQIERVRQRMNEDYGVLCGDERVESFLHHGRIRHGEFSHVLAFSDGLFPPSSAGDDPDFEAIAERYLEDGLDGVGRWVRQQEKADPHCRQFPRFKPHDDMAAIAVCLAPESARKA